MISWAIFYAVKIIVNAPLAPLRKGCDFVGKAG